VSACGGQVTSDLSDLADTASAGGVRAIGASGSRTTGGSTSLGGNLSFGGSWSLGGASTTGGYPSSGGFRPSGGLTAWGGTPSWGGASGGATAARLVARAVAVGKAHACAVLDDGTVRCWGDNGYGQLGDGATPNSVVPAVVSGITDAVAIAAGGDETCVVLTGGTVQCWGDNSCGQLGNGSISGRTATPVTVSGITNAAVITASGKHACALLRDGTIQCWGDDSSGQVVQGTVGTCQPKPLPALGTTIATAVSAGPSQTCAVLADRSVKCWGGSQPNVSILPDAVSVVTGQYATCVVDSTGGVDCWGAYAQLGTGTTEGSASTPTPITGLNGVAMAAIADFDYCAVRQSGTLRCWAYDVFSELGTVSSAGDMPGITNAVGVSLGGSSACIWLAGGEVRCWGQNSSGQLGNVNINFTAVPTTVIGF
jgi:alpha-tubulin suppressor-like RCC1 family protein